MAVSIDDPRLIESFRAGENDAFEVLVRAHRPALYRHALRKLSDHAAAEDAVQETFMRAYKARARVNDDWQLRPWLHQICANVCIDEANRRRKEAHKTSRWAIVDMPSRGVAPELERELGLDADHSEMTAAILSLPANYQEALSMRYVEELEYDEIADILNISEENVRARVSRASRAVRVLLRPVAAIIAFLAVIFGRRGSKSALAASVDSSGTVAAASSAAHVSATAQALAPLVETAQAVVIQAPAAVPLISKAAIGITMVVAATAPVTAPVVIERLRDEPAVEATVVVSDDATAGSPIDLGTALVADDVDAESSVDDATAPVDDPIDTPIDTPLDTVAPGLVEFGSQSASEAGAAPSESDDGGTAEGDESGSLPTPSLPSVVSGQGGGLSASGLLVEPSGPRLDLSGSAGLTVGDESITGSLSGRVNIAVDVDAENRRRVDGILTFSTGDGDVVIRLVGYAVARADEGYAMTGVFRVTGSDVGLADTGSFSGTLSSDLNLTMTV